MKTYLNKKRIVLSLFLALFLLINFIKIKAAHLSFSQLKNNTQITLDNFEQLTKDFLLSYPEFNHTMKALSEENKINFIYDFSQKPSFLGCRAMKNIVSSDAKIAFHADFHGDKKAMFNFIESIKEKGLIDDNLKIKNPIFHIVFLGDFADRGPDGLEVFYSAMLLRIKNPNNVEIVRGNHENCLTTYNESFFNELTQKFNFNPKKDGSKIQKIMSLFYKIYSALPSVIYLGAECENNLINYIMIVHGAIEPRFNPNTLLASKISKNIGKASMKIDNLDSNWLSQNIRTAFNSTINASFAKYSNNDFYKKIAENIEAGAPPIYSYQDLSSITGFLWGDFLPDDNYIAKSKRGVEKHVADFGKNLTKDYLDLCKKYEEYSVNAIIRGHQHNITLIQELVENNGIYGLWGIRQWDGKNGTSISIPKYSVWTVLASPAGISGKMENKSGKKVIYNFDTYITLELNKDFDKWKIYPTKIEGQDAL